MQTSRHREPQFFSFKWSKGLSWYLGQMPPPQQGVLTYEKSPNYLEWWKAPMRARAVAPEAKFVLIVTDPVKR